MKELSLNIHKTVQNGLNVYLLPANIKINEILKDTDAVVYGGAVRDALVMDTINDIDIMCMTKSEHIISTRLQERFQVDYKDSFSDHNLKDLMDEYNYNSPTLFRQVRTFIIAPEVKVQLIHPIIAVDNNPNRVFDAFVECLAGVDLSCCGLVYSPNGLFEVVPGAYNDCLNKKFRVLPLNKLYQKQVIDKRVTKMCQRGWTLIEKRRRRKPPLETFSNQFKKRRRVPVNEPNRPKETDKG